MKHELVALVTGAANGIGKAVARKLASRKISLFLTDINKEQGANAAKEISQTYGVRAEFLCTDVSKETEIQRMVAESLSLTGRLDYAANCAGICETVATEERSITTDWFDKVYSINTRGLWLCQKYEAEQMLRQTPRPIDFSPRPEKHSVPPQRGAITNVISISGLVSLGLAAYTPSKHAATGITKNGAKFYGPSGIRVNASCPGWTVTPMTERHMGNIAVPGTPEYDRSSINEKIACRRFGLAEEQANLISFLLSDESSYMNGALVVNDGGYYNIDN
ncbi:hypothetical protein FE257_008068 [Aspergillus nanangensis]|uniref:Uncharacterized protein n=1 Tax=Aspergillus nanangensis TaxID=2582783 RepID=A0AAD4GTX3_ASPNN|nr:hypothetical protein FE257_008068 [Aspergillus nanangensis]